MSLDHSLDATKLAGYSVSDRNNRSELPLIRNSIVGLAAFAIGGLAVTAILVGKDVPQSSMNAYFINGQTITEGHYALDLSRPIFVRGEVPICPTEDALAAYSPSDPAGCTILSSGAPAGLLGIVTDGMRQPTFQMQMQTPKGTIRGWVDYNNLTN
jgi:hypothetical protein